MNVKALGKEERREIILDLIKTSDQPVKARDLVDLTGKSESQIYADLKEMEQKNPRLKHSTRLGYYWDKSEDRYPPGKNSEGYPDPTAGLAMAMMDFKEKLIKTGEIWRVSSLNQTKSTNLFYVIKAHELGVVNCLEVYHKDEWAFSPDEHIVFLNDRSYVDCRRVLSKPTRYFESKSTLVHIDDGTEKVIAEQVADALGLCVMPDFKLGAPMQVLEEPIDLRLAKQKAEIYEKCFNAVVSMRS